MRATVTILAIFAPAPITCLGLVYPGAFGQLDTAGDVNATALPLAFNEQQRRAQQQATRQLSRLADTQMVSATCTPTIPTGEQHE